MPGPGGGRAVLITGCSSGIGHSAAHGLRQRGYRVFATARKPADVERLAAEGLESLALDLDDSASIAAAAGEVLERTGGDLWALFNNGAYGQPGAVEDLTRDVLRRQFETNLFGTHELTCAVLPAMRERGRGRIVQNSSVLGLVAMTMRGAYNASKFALEALSDTLRLELHGTGVHVCIVEPGPITSRFRDNARAAFERYVDQDASPHRELYRRVARRLAAENGDTPFTLAPAAVLTKVVHALESNRPRPRYYVTVPTYAFGALKRALGSRGMDVLLRAVHRAETR